MKRPTPSQNGEGASSSCPDLHWIENYPLVVEHLFDDRWSDGKVREVSTLTVSGEGGTFKVALNDREGRKSLYANAASLEDAMCSLEEALAKDGGNWRSWAARKGK